MPRRNRRSRPYRTHDEWCPPEDDDDVSLDRLAWRLVAAGVCHRSILGRIPNRIDVTALPHDDHQSPRRPGAHTNGEPMTQLTRDDLKAMSPEAIETARTDGRLDALLGVSPEQVALLERAREGRITPADVQELSALGRHELITAAHAEGRITNKEN